MKIEVKPIRIKPLDIKPLMPVKLSQPEGIKSPVRGQSLSTNTSIKMGGGTETLPDAGGQPEPTREDIQKFNANKDKIVEPIVIGSLRKHRQDVLHGSQSLKRLLTKYSRDPGDFDMFSPTEKSRAQQIERAIDRKVGADVVETRYVPIPKVSLGADDPSSSKELYRVTSPELGEVVDIMERPKKLKTVSQGGITHESLDEAYKKAQKRKSLQPIQAYKALSDMRDIEEYWARRGVQPPELVEERQSIVWRNKNAKMSGMWQKSPNII